MVGQMFCQSFFRVLAGVPDIVLLDGVRKEDVDGVHTKKESRHHGGTGFCDRVRVCPAAAGIQTCNLPDLWSGCTIQLSCDG